MLPLSILIQVRCTIALFPFLLLAITGSSLFDFVFGQDWTEAGIYAQLLSFKLFLTFVFGPFLGLANVLEKQELNFNVR